MSGPVNVRPEPPEVLERFAALYRQFVRPGGLAFDIGASIGENTELLALAGARVVAVEPLEECAAVILASSDVHVVRRAVGATRGTLELMVSEHSLDVSTASQDWVGALTADGFRLGPYGERRRVEMCTLDDLIEEFGSPDFVKIDVEGFELEVLAGLSRPVPALSLETHACLGDAAAARVWRLVEIGFSAFAVSENHSAVLSEWMDADAAELAVRRLRWGDLYARAGITVR
jgi:FkbM family methyltransferase